MFGFLFDLVQALTSVVAVASIVAASTPTPKDVHIDVDTNNTHTQ